MNRLLILTLTALIMGVSVFYAQNNPNPSGTSSSEPQSEEQLLRIGGLDIPLANYGSIQVGPHSDRDSLKTQSGNGRFTNYYMELSVWARGSSNGRELFVNGDASREPKELRWFPSSEMKPAAADNKRDQTIISIFSDRPSEEKGPALGITVQQEMTAIPGRDWAVIRWDFTNGSSRAIEDFHYGIKLDADVPGNDQRPSAENDMIGFACNTWYLYDQELGKEKSDIIGLMPLVANGKIKVNYWTASTESERESEKAGKMETQAEQLPVSPDDYRVLLSASADRLEAGETATLIVALIECRKIGKLEKIEEEAREFAKVYFADALSKNQREAENNADLNQKPVATALLQNYPNPFNPATTIRYQLKEEGYVELAIYNLNGELVRRLAEGVHSAGEHEARWNGTDHANNKVGSGIYLYRLKTRDGLETRKMLFLY